LSGEQCLEDQELLHVHELNPCSSVLKNSQSDQVVDAWLLVVLEVGVRDLVLQQKPGCVVCPQVLVDVVQP